MFGWLVRFFCSVLLIGGSLGGLTACAPSKADYVSNDSALTTYAPDKRGEPISLSGKTSQGVEVKTTEFKDTPLVVNVWYASCGPCRAEAPDLKTLSDEHEKVKFLGINVKDDAATAAAFERNFDIKYPSIIDSDGQAIKALGKQVNPQAVPVTLVLDKQHRVQARFLGMVNKSNLKSILTQLEN